MLILCAILAVASVLCWPQVSRRRIVLGVLSRRRVAAGRSTQRRRALPSVLLRRRAAATSDALLLELLGGVAAGLEAGLPPPDAVAGARAALEPRLGEVPELVAWLTRLTDAARDGDAVGAVWSAMGEELGLPVATQVGRAWSVSERLGSPLTDAVRSTMAAHEAAARLDRSFAAQSAGPRATVQVLTLLPVLGLALMPVLGVNLAAAYPPPVLLLAVLPGLVLLALGRALTRRMVDRALRTPRLS